MAKSVVFESPSAWSLLAAYWYRLRGRCVYVLEPFSAYHHGGPIRFYPPVLPVSFQKLIRDKKAVLITAQEMDAKSIYSSAAERAVGSIDAVFETYQRQHREILDFVCRQLNDDRARDAFRIDLADRLSEFFSANILWKRVSEYLQGQDVIMRPHYNVVVYRYWERFLKRYHPQTVYAVPGTFSFPSRITGSLRIWRENLTAWVKLLAQAFLSSFSKSSVSCPEGSFSYGMAVISPGRQLNHPSRGPGFLIDGQKIHSRDVIYFLTRRVTQSQRTAWEKFHEAKCEVPGPGRFFSHGKIWRDFCRLIWRRGPLSQAMEIKTGALLFFQYFVWKEMLEKISLKHFITHCDFGVPHVGRNAALRQRGVQTWYFTDSMNFSNSFHPPEEQHSCRHPFWTYLTYDHFVTWGDAIADYFRGHPQNIGNYHVVGCLWAQRNGAVCPAHFKGRFIITAFDTSYSCNHNTSYREGIAFAQHLLKLIDEFPDCYLILKEKKARRVHAFSDGVYGPQLLELYETMQRHPRIELSPGSKDNAFLIAISNLVVSFPFTSTTYEALSIDRPAVWHDPLGYYRRTPYGQIKGVVTFGYDELKERVLLLKQNRSSAFVNPVPRSSPFLDPYRDGKAVERFRDLLLAETKKTKKAES